MLEPSTDAVFWNEVANHAGVRPYLGMGVDFFDTAPVLSFPNVYALRGEGGGFIFLPTSVEGLYSVHTLMLPGHRGGKAVRMAMASLDWMFGNTNAKAISTEVPKPNMGARWLALRCGFVSVGVRPGDWLSPDGSHHDMEDFVLTRNRWAERQSGRAV